MICQWQGCDNDATWLCEGGFNVGDVVACDFHATGFGVVRRGRIEAKTAIEYAQEGATGQCSCRTVGECPINDPTDRNCYADQLRDYIRHNMAGVKTKQPTQQPERTEARDSQPGAMTAGTATKSRVAENPTDTQKGY